MKRASVVDRWAGVGTWGQVSYDAKGMGPRPKPGVSPEGLFAFPFGKKAPRLCRRSRRMHCDC